MWKSKTARRQDLRSVLYHNYPADFFALPYTNPIRHHGRHSISSHLIFHLTSRISLNPCLFCILRFCTSLFLVAFDDSIPGPRGFCPGSLSSSFSLVPLSRTAPVFPHHCPSSQGLVRYSGLSTSPGKPTVISKQSRLDLVQSTETSKIFSYETSLLIPSQFDLKTLQSKLFTLVFHLRKA